MSEIKGLSELMAKLNRMTNNADELVTTALMRGGKLVQRTAKKECPVNEGQLRNSIEVTKEEPLVVSVGTNVEHAIFVEFGTGDKGDPAVAHTTKESWVYQDKDGNFKTARPQAPQPFLSKGLNDNKKQILTQIKNDLQQEVKK